MPVWAVALLCTLLALFALVAVVTAIVALTRKKPQQKEPEKETKRDVKKLADPESGKTKGTDKSTKTDKSGKSMTSKSSSNKKTDRKVGKSSTKGKADNVEERSRERETDGTPHNLRSEGSEGKKNGSELALPSERPLEKRLDEPMTRDEFFYYLNKLARQIVDYCVEPEAYKVANSRGEGSVLDKELPDKPASYQQAQEMLDFLKTAIYGGMTHYQHPRMLGTVLDVGRSFPDMLAELFISSLGVVGSSWEACPSLVEMEYAMVNWVGRALGIPRSFLFEDKIGSSPGGGSFMDSASEAIFTTILAARQWKIRELAGKSLATVNPQTGISYDLETMHDVAKKLVFYCSRKAHSSMEKGCKLGMVKCRSIATEGQSDFGLTGQQLETSILKDVERGLVPTYVLVVLGTNLLGVSDDLASILPVAKKYGLYVHVDAAVNGMFWIVPELRPSAGLEEAHSISLSLHKAMLQSASSVVLFTRDKKIHLDAFATGPDAPATKPTDVVDLAAWSIHSQRRFRALKTWFVMNMYGLEGLRRYVKKVVEYTRHFSTRLREKQSVRIFGKPALGQFCFQYAEKTDWTREQVNQATEQLARHINKSCRLYVTSSNCGDNHVIRILLSCELTPRWTVDDNLATLVDLIDEFRAGRGGQDQQPQQMAGGTRAEEDKGVVGSINLTTDRTKGSLSDVSVVTGAGLPPPSPR